MMKSLTLPVLFSLIFTVADQLSAGEMDKAIVIDEEGSSIHDTLSPYADFRFRYEADWDSVNSSGVPRDDRHRLRVRGRVGIKYEPTDTLTFDVRARTGDSHSQQSPHLTIHDFNDGDRNDFSGILDKYYFQYAENGVTFWGGRNGFPFWKQNELFWDDDATITGAALSVVPDGWDEAVTATVGAFYLPDGGWELNGQMYAGQVKYTRSFGELKLTAAEGFYFIDGSSGASHLRNGNGGRDYAILGNQVELQHDIFGIPVAVGADVYCNFKNYSGTSPNAFTAANADEDMGYVFSTKFGSLKDPGDFQFGYYYAWLETFSVNASYAQDDWVRWGSATQTDSSDLKGHEFRLTYRAAKQLDIMARLYAVDAITSQQDGMRFRIDFNYKF
ncbi:MAG: putative porin [Verrucomicrobiae bacterium]|nr:putative porin [Verrucomicrobiae bacterium]